MRTHCPHCTADLRNGAYWHTIGNEVPGVYDGVLFWSCPFCHWAWHRWLPDQHRHARAQQYIDENNADVIEKEDR